MKFFKRLFAWSFRRKERPAKKKRVYAYRGANAGVKYTRKATAPAPVLSGTRSDGTTISDTGTWPTPRMLSELGARRDDVVPSTPSIIEITKTRQEMLHSDRTLPRQQSTTAPISSPDESDENIYPESTQAVVGSPRRIPRQSRNAVYSLSLPEEGFGEAPEGPEVLQNEQLHPTYNVTVHRRKLHAVTQLPSTVIDGTPTRTSFAASTSSLYSTVNTGEDTALHASPQTSTRKRRQTMDEGRLMQNLSDDPAMLDALRLYYDKDPSHMFSNSPSRPELGPRSSSAGNLTTRSALRVVDTTIQSPDESISPSSASTLDRTLDESFLAGPDSNYIATAPLNVPSIGVSERLPLRSSAQLLPQVSNAHLRLSSPMLFDFLFSQPSLEHTIISPSTTVVSSGSTRLPEASSEQIPAIVVKAATPATSPILTPLSPSFTSDEEKENRPPATLLSRFDSNKENIPPQQTLRHSRRSGSLSSGTAHPQTTIAPPAGRSHDSAFFSFYSTPAASLSSIDVATPIPSPRKRKPSYTFKRTKSHSGACPTTPSSEAGRIFDAYAEMTTCGTDSEEEKLIESAVIASWESARLTTATVSSPSDSFTGTGTPSGVSVSTLSPVSPASTFELATPALSPEMGFGFSGYDDVNGNTTAMRHGAYTKHKVGDWDKTASPGPHVHLLPEASEIEPLIRSSLDSERDESGVFYIGSPSPPAHLHDHSRLLFSHPVLTPTNSHSLPVSAPATVPAIARARAMGRPVAGSPHRGIVGLDGGSNREAFLYGQDDDETFARKLDSRLALMQNITYRQPRASPGPGPRTDTVTGTGRAQGGGRRYTENVSRYSAALNDAEADTDTDVDRPLAMGFSSTLSSPVRRASTMTARDYNGSCSSPPKQTLSQKLGLGARAPLGSGIGSGENKDVFGSVVAPGRNSQNQNPSLSRRALRKSHMHSYSMPSLPLSATENQSFPTRYNSSTSRSTALALTSRNHTSHRTLYDHAHKQAKANSPSPPASPRSITSTHSKTFTSRIPRLRTTNGNGADGSPRGSVILTGVREVSGGGASVNGIGADVGLGLVMGMGMGGTMNGSPRSPLIRPRPGISSLRAGDTMSFGMSRAMPAIGNSGRSEKRF